MKFEGDAGGGIAAQHKELPGNIQGNAAIYPPREPHQEGNIQSATVHAGDAELGNNKKFQPILRTQGSATAIWILENTWKPP